MFISSFPKSFLSVSLMDLLCVFILMMILSLFWLLAGRRIDFATEPAAKY